MVNVLMESLRNSFQLQWKLVWRESLWNSFQNQWKLVLRALGQFPNRFLKEFLPKSTEINLERNPYGIPLEINGLLVNFPMESLRNSFQYQWKFVWRESLCKINGNWSAELLVNFPMESLRDAFQYQWKLVWRALGRFSNGILEEFLSKSTEVGLQRILMEFLSKLLEIGLGSS